MVGLGRAEERDPALLPRRGHSGHRDALSYSERTIKGVIQEIERELGARSRAHAVAEGIRQGLI